LLVMKKRKKRESHNHQQGSPHYSSLSKTENGGGGKVGNELRKKGPAKRGGVWLKKKEKYERQGKKRGTKVKLRAEAWTTMRTSRL